MKTEPIALFEEEGNSRMVSEIHQFFRKFLNISGNSRIIYGNSRVVPNILGAFRACVACIVMMDKVTIVIRVDV